MIKYKTICFAENVEKIQVKSKKIKKKSLNHIYNPIPFFLFRLFNGYKSKLKLAIYKTQNWRIYKVK